MRFLRFIIILLLSVSSTVLLGQDWSEERHVSYVDSIKAIETAIGYEQATRLMKYGLSRGAERYTDVYLDYLFAIQFQSFALSQRDSMDKYLKISLMVVESSAPEQMWRYFLSKGNYYKAVPVDLPTARKYYEKSAQELRRIGNVDKMSAVLNNLSSTLYEEAERDSARLVLRQALQIADSLGQVIPSMNAKVDLANLYSLDNDYNNAAVYYSEAYDYSKNENIRRSHIYNATNMGRLYQNLGQFDKAADYFEEGLVAAREVNQIRVLAAIYLQKADCEVLAGEFETADQTLLEMVNDSLEMNSLFTSLHQMLQGRILLANGEVRAATEVFSKLMREYTDLDRSPYKPDIYLGYAQCMDLQGDKQRALNAIDRGRDNRRARFDTDIKLLELKTKIFEGQGRYKSALMANRERNVFADSLVTLNEIGIRLTEQARASLALKESAMQDLSEDFSIVEAKGERQAKVIAGLAAAIVGLGLIAFFYSRHRKLQLEKDLADVKQNLLRIQINPHFIFNILNSIQSSFLQEDQEKTIHLFNKFSNLMRRVLENSVNSFIPLNEELELLINYMELEKARTKDKFDYEVSIEEDVDIYLEEVPTMVLQIFLENSVWHGLVPKENRGKILLNISKEDGVLKIAIEDDGVGRSFSLKNKSKDQKNKKSMGTDLVMQRIHLLNRKFGKGLALSINNGKDNIGTRVELAV